MVPALSMAMLEVLALPMANLDSMLEMVLIWLAGLRRFPSDSSRQICLDQQVRGKSKDELEMSRTALRYTGSHIGEKKKVHNSRGAYNIYMAYTCRNLRFLVFKSSIVPYY